MTTLEFNRTLTIKIATDRGKSVRPSSLHTLNMIRFVTLEILKVQFLMGYDFPPYRYEGSWPIDDNTMEFNTSTFTFISPDPSLFQILIVVVLTFLRRSRAF